MFTGIVEECGEIVALEPVEKGARLVVSSSFTSEVAIGESVANNGVCLTVTEIDGDKMVFDLLHETMRLTNLGDVEPGDLVNLERSLRVGDRLSGHFVQGHVDLCAELLALDPVGQDYKLTVALPAGMAHLVVHKGSICVNGISLTIAELEDASFTIWIIPHTFDVTNLKRLKVGNRINLEFDLLAKHLARLQEVRG